MLPITQIIIKWILLSTISIHSDFITTDYLQNAYFITTDNSLVKVDSTGKTLFTYHQNKYGALRFVDASNPLKLILNYPDYGTIVMLDNTLSELGVYSLKNLGIFDYHAVCFSPRDNNFWVFDENDYKLKTIDRNGNIVLESSDMFQQLGYAINPVFMEEENEFLYVSDPDLGILIFDDYGVYYETLAFKEIMKFEVRNDQLYYRYENSLHAFHLKTLEEKEIVLPPVPFLSDLSLETNRLFILAKDSAMIFAY